MLDQIYDHYLKRIFPDCRPDDAYSRNRFDLIILLNLRGPERAGRAQAASEALHEPIFELLFTSLYLSRPSASRAARVRRASGAPAASSRKIARACTDPMRSSTATA